MSWSDRGVLHPERLPDFERRPAPPEAAHLVRWFWLAEWDLAPGEVSRHEVLAFPACNLVVEPDLVGLAGPTTRVSVRELTGRGRAVAALLRPAAVPLFTDDPGGLRDQYVPLDLPDLQERVRSTADRERAVSAFADWLVHRLREASPEARRANRMAELVDSDPELVRVDEIARRLAVSPRTLQRLARRYVGLSPASMVRRRRLQEAAERVRRDPAADLAGIAADLGYADHAHLTNDFRHVLGFTPSRYREVTQ